MLILDGWDEINVGASEGYQQRVARMLEGVRQEFLRDRAFPVRIILTGRPTPAIEASKFFRDDTRLLAVRNLTPGQLEGYFERVAEVTAAAPPEAEGGWSLQEVKALPQVLKRYRADFKAQKKDDRGSAVAPSQSLEILGLPLLAHLALRLLARWPEEAEKILEDTTSLYRRLVDLVISKAGKPEEADIDTAATAMLHGDELRQLLRGTAEAMTHLGTEAISRAELEVRLGLDEGEAEEEFSRLSRDRTLSRLMISFFFKGGGGEGGLEFSHKSFREYLFAEQVVEELKAYGRRAPAELAERDENLYWKDFEDGDPRKDLCHRLAELLGPVWTTPEVGGHLRQLLEWEVARAKEPEQELGEATASLSLEGWRRVRDGLADAWDWWGEGVHLRPQPSKRSGYREWEYSEKPLALKIAENDRLRSDLRARPTPPRTVTVDAHLGDSLCQLAAITHFEVAVAEGFELSKGWEFDEENESPRRYQRPRLQGETAFLLFAPACPSTTYLFNYSARINASGFRQPGPFPRGANFRGADFRGADLGWVDFRGVDLVEAVLRWADLRDARLDRAILHGADLRGATFGGSYPQPIVFEGASFRGANFRGANLRGANLRGAFGLDQGQLKSARGDETTKLPEGLERPGNWGGPPRDDSQG